MWSFNIKALASIESSKMYRLEVLQVERKATEQKRKKAGRRQKTRPDRKDTNTKGKEKKRGRKKPRNEIKVCTEREEEREIKKIDITHPHQGPP